MASSSLRIAAALATALAASSASALQVSLPKLESNSYIGGPSIGPCSGALLSGTGRYVTFTCLANDLVIGDTNDRNDTFIVDRHLRATERVSVDSLQQEYRFGSGGGFPSVDGAQVVFTSLAPLDPDLTFPYFSPGVGNAFLRDRRSGMTELIGRTATGGYAPLTGATQLRGLSFTTSTVLFSSEDNMLTSDLPPIPRPTQLYARNWETASIELITQTPGGAFSFLGTTGAATMSEDGRFVAFISGASDLGPSNPANENHLFLRDRLNHTTRRLSFPAAGGDFSGVPYYQEKAGHFTANGQYLAVEANSDELADGDCPGLSDVYLVNTATARYELISRGYSNQPPDNASFEIDVSADGRYVAFFSRASNLLPSPQPPAVYLKDRLTGELVNVSAPLGAPRAQHIPVVSLSADASTVAFSWHHPDSEPLVGGRSLVYTVDVRHPTFQTPVSIPATGHEALMVLGLLLTLATWLATRMAAVSRQPLKSDTSRQR